MAVGILEPLRLMVPVALLGLVFSLQFVAGDFIVPGVWAPLLGVVTVSFLVRTIAFMLRTERASRLTNDFIYVSDLIALGVFFFLLPPYQALVFFLFLLNIALAGVERGLSWSLFVGALTGTILTVLTVFQDPAGSHSPVLMVLAGVALLITSFLSDRVRIEFTRLQEQVIARTQDLSQLRNLNELIVESIGTGLLIADNSGEVVRTNKALLDILGVTPRDPLPMSLFIKAVQSQLSPVQPPMALTQQRLELTHQTPAGERRRLEVLTSPLFDEQKGRIGWILLVQDLTEVTQLRDSLRQREKLAAVGQLAAGIAHEIRNPLASISGSVEMLHGTLKDLTDEDGRLFRIILKEIDRLNGLISEFLDYVRVEEKPRDSININDILQTVLEIAKLNPNARSDVDFRLQLNSRKRILGQPDKLKQAFLNIVINALQAMDKVPVATLTVSTYDRESGVVVNIRDSGVGMNETTLRRLFEPFYTTKPKGTGLGLAMTHKIFESHEARVFVESDEGNGTTFLIEFPSVNHDLPLESRAAVQP